MCTAMRVLLLALLLVVLAACGDSDPESAQSAATQSALLDLDVDPATFVTVDYQRSGGNAGYQDSARLYMDGHVVLERAGQAPTSFQLSAEQISEIDAAFAELDFHRRIREAGTPPAPAPDSLVYDITRNGVLVQTTLRASDSAGPSWARPLIALLDRLLLEPDNSNGRTNVLGEADVEQAPQTNVPDQAPAPPPDSPARIVLVDFQRTGGPEELADRIQVFLDRSYSVSRRGIVEAGRLSEDEMGALLRLLEAANLREHRGEYLPTESCAECMAYDLAYRNFYGEYRVRALDGAVPAWFMVIADTLSDAFLETQDLLALTTPVTLPTDTTTLTPISTATPISRATATTSSTVPRQPAAQPTPIRTPSPTPTARTAESSPTVEVAPGTLQTGTATVARTATPTKRATNTATTSPRATNTATPTASATHTATATTRATSAATATPSATNTATATVRSSSTPTPTAQREATSTPEPTSTPTQTTEPADLMPSPTVTATATATVASSTSDFATFLNDLGAQGAEASIIGGRLVKPYLSAFGTLVRVDRNPGDSAVAGVPVQVYQYGDEATLDADLAGIAPDASSVDGYSLSWPAPPHFWRRGPLLVLAVTDDEPFVDLLSVVLGPQVAGR